MGLEGERESTSATTIWISALNPETVGRAVTKLSFIIIQNKQLLLLVDTLCRLNAHWTFRDTTVCFIILFEMSCWISSEMGCKIKKRKLKSTLFMKKNAWVCSPFISAKQINKLKMGNTRVFPFDGFNKSHIRLLTWYWFMPLDTDLTFFLKLKHDSTLSVVFWKGLQKNYSQWVFISQTNHGSFLVNLRSSSCLCTTSVTSAFWVLAWHPCWRSESSSVTSAKGWDKRWVSNSQKQ